MNLNDAVNGASAMLCALSAFGLARWMDMRHGRAEMPFGKYKGVRIRLLPDDYLSWLTTTGVMTEDRWTWLRDSLISELKFRGLNYEMAGTADPEIVEQPEEPSRLFVVSRRKFRA